MIAAINDLCHAMQNETSLMAWTQHIAFDESDHFRHTDRSRAAYILKQIEYTNEQAPRETLLCAGFIGASPETLKLVQAVNESKDSFKKSILALKSAKIPKTDPFLSAEFNTILPRSSETTQVLQKLGLARLHLKQCYRKIPILQSAPSKISWTWAHTRAIKKIDVAKAIEMLLKKGQRTAIDMQLQKLQSLSAKEPLAIVQELAPHLRANLVFKEAETQQRQMIKGPLPLFFPCTPETPRPHFSPPVPKQHKDDSRSKRSDIKIDPTPFIPAIRAHRYLVISS
jgi:hypothetical protein